MKKLFSLILFFLLLKVNSHANANSIDLAKFIPLINTDFREQLFQNALKPYNSQFGIETVEVGNNKFVLYKFQNDGFMLNISNNRVLSIVLYKEGENNYRQYMGKMPLKINFTMTRGQIEKIIGPPLECIAAQTINDVKINLACTYPYSGSVNFRVRYDSNDSLDYKTKPLMMVFASSINKAFN
jgi:hypothetical protein